MHGHNSKSEGWIVANQSHLKILMERTVEDWNLWRKANPKIRPNLNKADLYNVYLISNSRNEDGPDLSEANLSGADLCDANLSGAKLERTNLNGAQLNGSILTGAELWRARLKAATLIKSDMSGTFLTAADFSAATLRGADLHGAEIIGSNFDDADFTNCIMFDTVLRRVDLSRAKGLETVKHEGPSSIDIDTIYSSRGNIPEAFLRGAGIPEPFISNMKSLVVAMAPIEFYSCFISYSSKDQDFAERLHADLRSKNVRCWFAPEDLKIGERLRSSFDEAIRVHDKLMVVLSENSVASKWVEKEVETAFGKENRDPHKRTGLFPIMLDDAVMETDEAWAADIRRTRHIGDFRDWKNHDAYKKALEKLLRDLKA